MIYNLESRFQFGKYKGAKIESVFTGEPPTKELLSEFMDHILNEIIKRIVNSSSIEERPHFENDGNSISFSGNTNNRDSCYKVINAFIKFLHHGITRKTAESGKYHFENYNFTYHSNHLFYVPLSGNPGYIYWALKNVYEFCLPQEDFKRLATLDVLAYNNIKFRIDSNRLFYEGINYNTYKYNRILELTDLNSTKLEAACQLELMEDEYQQTEPANAEKYYNHIPDSEYDRRMCSLCEETPCMCSHPPWL
jgi:hypothetical protein